MRNYLLTEIFGECPKVKLIDLLISNPQSEYTKTDMAGYSGIARSTVYGILDELEEYGIVKQTKKVGRSQLYQLNREADLTKLISAFNRGLEDIDREEKSVEDFKIKYDIKKGKFIKYKVEKD